MASASLTPFAIGYERGDQLKHPGAVGVGVIAGVEQRHDLAVGDFQSSIAQQPCERTRQVRVNEVLLPRGEHSVHALVVARNLKRSEILDLARAICEIDDLWVSGEEG